MARATQSATGAEHSEPFCRRYASRREVELAAVDAVMAAERAPGNVPVDVSAQNVGCDIASRDPKSGTARDQAGIGGVNDDQCTKQATA